MLPFHALEACKRFGRSIILLQFCAYLLAQCTVGLSAAADWQPHRHRLRIRAKIGHVRLTSTSHTSPTLFTKNHQNYRSKNQHQHADNEAAAAAAAASEWLSSRNHRRRLQSLSRPHVPAPPPNVSRRRAGSHCGGKPSGGMMPLSWQSCSWRQKTKTERCVCEVGV